MPVNQSGLCTLTTPEISMGTAPVTTITGSVPPSRSSAMPRSASVDPANSMVAFGCPSLDPSPAASSIPATCSAMASR
jgi:hypothetical protein